MAAGPKGPRARVRVRATPGRGATGRSAQAAADTGLFTAGAVARRSGGPANPSPAVLDGLATALDMPLSSIILDVESRRQPVCISPGALSTGGRLWPRSAGQPPAQLDSDHSPPFHEAPAPRSAPHKALSAHHRYVMQQALAAFRVGALQAISSWAARGTRVNEGAHR